MTIRKAYVDTADGQIHYRYAEGNGIPLVMLHRTPASSASFEPMMRAMLGQRPLYAFDTPGFGASFDPGGEPDILDYRDWIQAGIDGVGVGEFHLYAHHTGTHIAAEIAADQPERVRTLMLNGAAFLSEEEREQFRAMVGTASPPDADGNYVRDTFKLIAGLFEKFDPVLVHNEVIGALRSNHTRDKAFTAIWDQDFVAVLARTSAPLMCISAADDFFAQYLDRITAAHPGARIEITAPATVASPELDTQGQVNVVESFIAEHETR